MTTAIVSPPSSLALTTIERATSSHHASAEADLFRVLDDATDIGYQRFLCCVFRFEYAVEAQLARIDSLPLQFVAQRLKTGRLGDDLLALGRPRHVDPIFSEPMTVPRFSDGHHALGWLYVLQRNTLHHQQLYRALVPRLRATLQSASRYLTTHASDVYQRWHELGALLDRVAAAKPGALDQVIEGAREAFEHQHRWYTRARAALAGARDRSVFVRL